MRKAEIQDAGNEKFLSVGGKDPCGLNDLLLLVTGGRGMETEVREKRGGNEWQSWTIGQVICSLFPETMKTEQN